MAARRIIIKLALFEAVHQQSTLEPRLKCNLSANQITSLTAAPKSVQFRNSANPLRDYRKSCSSRVLFFFLHSDFRRARFFALLPPKIFLFVRLWFVFHDFQSLRETFFRFFWKFLAATFEKCFRCLLSPAEHFHVPSLRVSFLRKNLSLPSERFQLVFHSPLCFILCII